MTYDSHPIASGGATINGDLYTPSGTAPAGVVVIAYGSDGLVDNEHGPWETMIRGYAEALRARGFFALIPDYFGGPPAPITPAHLNEWAAALVDSVTDARAIPRVDASRIGLLGFSLGGHLVLRVRAAARPRALVEYFAPVLDSIGAGGSVPHAQIHHGTNDLVPGTSFSNALAIERTLGSEKTAVILYPYEGAGHGFAADDEPNKKAKALSQTRTLTFFDTYL